jgi:hypothetical protein
MVSEYFKIELAGAWCAAVIVLGAIGIVAGVDITISNGELWLATCVLPPTVLLLVYRDRAALPLAALRHVVNKSAKVVRP